MSHELRQPAPDELRIWRAKQYTLESKEVDTLIEGLQPGEATRLMSAIKSGNLQEAGMLPQLMVLATKSTIIWHPGLVKRGRVAFDPAVATKRQQFIAELRTIQSQLHEDGIAALQTVPEDRAVARMVALGVFAEQALHTIDQLEKDDSVARSAPGFGQGKAKLYGNSLERVTEGLALNERPITDTEAVLDTALFLMRINGEPSQYERTRNRNVARLLLSSLNGGTFTHEALRQTNIGVMDGLGHGGFPRDFEHWAGTGKNPPTPVEIPSRLAAWQNNVDALLASNHSNHSNHSNPELEIAQLAADYNEIHPWREGNGRSLTVEVNKLRSRTGLEPLYIPQSENREYIFALGNPTSTKDSEELAAFYAAHTVPREQFIEAMQHIITTGSDS